MEEKFPDVLVAFPQIPHLICEEVKVDGLYCGNIWGSIVIGKQFVHQASHFFNLS